MIREDAAELSVLPQRGHTADPTGVTAPHDGQWESLGAMVARSG